jgi:SAM-dependent methyltransferase
MSFHYSGDELPLMVRAVRWKAYVAAQLRPYLGPSVLEVGAGIGGNIPHLFHPPVQHWTALEPDAAQAQGIADPRVRVIVGALDAITAESKFNAILYLDVLEHIADDAAELRQAATHLLPGGHLIVLAPAHPFLFSPMDTAVGHYRRYTRARLRGITPAGCQLACLHHLDAVGFFASLANRLMLRAPRLSPGQISLWDGVMVPTSRILDPLLGHRFGRSLLAVWRRTG